MDRRVRAGGRAGFSMLIAPVLASFFFPKGTKEWHNPVIAWLTNGYQSALHYAIRWRYVTVGSGLAAVALSPLYCTVAW